MGRRLVENEREKVEKEKSEEKKHKMDLYSSWISGIVYAGAIIMLRIFSYKNYGGYLIICFKTAVIVLALLFNYIMIRYSVPNRKLLKAIKEFDMKTQNKKEIINQRECLINLMNDFPHISSKKLCIVTFVITIVVFVFYMMGCIKLDILLNFILDFETIMMAILLLISTHYKLVTYSKLKNP